MNRTKLSRINKKSPMVSDYSNYQDNDVKLSPHITKFETKKDKDKQMDSDC